MIVGTTVLMRPSAGLVLLGRRTSVRMRHVEVTTSDGGDRVMFQLYLFEKRMVCLTKGTSQANEGMWGMPGHIEAMKAAVSCDKLGGAAHTR